jgi:hypothetical protein
MEPAPLAAVQVEAGRLSASRGGAAARPDPDVAVVLVHLVEDEVAQLGALVGGETRAG